MRSKWMVRTAVAVSLSATSAFGQYPGGSSGTYNGGGYHASTGIAIGAAAVGAEVGILALRAIIATIQWPAV